jgi:hypothetical protein
MKKFRTQQKIKYGKQYYRKHKDIVRMTSKKTYENNKEDILKRHKIAHWNRDPRELILQRAKIRARIEHLPFNLVKEDIILPKICPVFGFKLIRNRGAKTAAYNSYSIDKIVPSLGYIKGNIQILSYKANVMKHNATQKELLLFAKWILKEDEEEEKQQ